MPRRPLACLLLLVVLASGCQGEVTADPPSALAPTPTEVLSPMPTASPSEQPLRELTGVVQAGVEAGCLLLSGAEGDTEIWLLVGATGSIEAGDQVRVEGRAAPDLMTTCQQGTPFTVIRVL